MVIGALFSRSRAAGKLLGLKTVRAIPKADVGFGNLLIAGTAVGVGVLTFSLAPTRSYPPRGLSATARAFPEYMQKGCGSNEYNYVGKGKDGSDVDASFPATHCPKEMPDLSNHKSFMAEVLEKEPKIYDKLKSKVTSTGVTLAKCMKRGVDNPTKEEIRDAGLVAGDEESYAVFKELFDPVIDQRHNGYPITAKHATDLDFDKLSKTRIDPTCYLEGRCQFVVSTKVRARRSVKGFRFPPSCSFEERRVLEHVISKACLNLNLGGDYLPLAGSRSFAMKPNVMSEEKAKELRDERILFEDPQSTEFLSSGMARHWPDARGVWHNDSKKIFVWQILICRVGLVHAHAILVRMFPPASSVQVGCDGTVVMSDGWLIDVDVLLIPSNEGDHLQIVSTDKGDGIRNIFKKFAAASTEVERQLSVDGYKITKNDHLGHINTSPSDLGTGMKAGAIVCMPILSDRDVVREICHKFRLEARNMDGKLSGEKFGIWEITNLDRLGKSEVDLTNTFIEGVAQFIRWEMMLEQGKNINSLVPN
eukprot:gene748-453_t